jgi:quercetin dioxygenase-like cupin family protein
MAPQLCFPETLMIHARFPVAAFALVALVTTAAWALDAGAPARTRLTPAEISQQALAPSAPGTSGVSGIRTRVLHGNPAAPGLYSIQLEVPANTQIQAHTHPDPRVATVVAGTWHFGYGETFDASALKPLPPGSFYTEPAGLLHFARTGDAPVTLIITGLGPSGTRYADDTQPQGQP